MYQEQKRTISKPRYWVLPLTNRTNNHQAGGVNCAGSTPSPSKGGIPRSLRKGSPISGWIERNKEVFRTIALKQIAEGFKYSPGHRLAGENADSFFGKIGASRHRARPDRSPTRRTELPKARPATRRCGSRDGTSDRHATADRFT